MNRRANYIILGSDPNLIIIRDVGPWDQHPSVTNDAENVVRELVAKGLLTPGRRLFYYDSDGILDEILIKDGAFAGFAPGGFACGRRG